MMMASSFANGPNVTTDNNNNNNMNTEDDNDSSWVVHLHVTGMMCQRNCGTTVTNALSNLPGAVEAHAIFEEHRAWVRFGLHASSEEMAERAAAAVDAVECVGFDAAVVPSCQSEATASTANTLLAATDLLESSIAPTLPSHCIVSSDHPYMVHLHVTGMMCQRNCGTTVENALRALPGVVQARAVFPQKRAFVLFEGENGAGGGDPAPKKSLTRQDCEQAAVEAVEDVGFDATVMDPPTTMALPPVEQQKQTSIERQGTFSSLGDSITADSTEHGDKMVQAAPNTILLSVHGMSCAICTGRVERALLEVPGIVQASVILATNKAAAVVDGDTLDLIEETAQACCDAIQQAGYGCEILESNGAGGGGMDLTESARQMEGARLQELQNWQRLFVASFVLTTPLAWLDRHHKHHGNEQGTVMSVPSSRMWIMFLLSSLVQLGVGRRFYKSAWMAWNHGRVMGMDFLVVLGTTCSYGYSVVLLLLQVITGEQTALEPTFLTGAMLLTFVTFGKLLESLARGKTASSLKKLMELQPSHAWKVISPVQDYTTAGKIDLAALETEEVTATEIRAGDYVRVLPGARIPSDGILVAVSSSGPVKDGKMEVAQAFLDESTLSGEPFPVPKSVGDAVYGSTVNQLSVLLVRITAAGSDTVLAKICRLVEDAQRHKAPIQAYADHVASIFAPVVIGLASFTFVAWLVFNQEAAPEERFFLAFMSAIAVVVVACPCALGLATPTAVMVGTGVGATHGLLIKGGHVLETMNALDTIIFDKTGTLTSGKAILSDCIDLVDDDSHGHKGDDPLFSHLPQTVGMDKVGLWLAACAEAQSEHPLARAIVNGARKIWASGDLTCADDGVVVDNFHILPGSGVECRVSKPLWGSWLVRIGNREWTKAPMDGGIPEQMTCSVGDTEAEELRTRGKIAVYLSVVQEDAVQTRRRVVAVLGIEDQIKPEARSTVAALDKMGVDVWMCTGDHESTALAVAAQLGIPEENVCAGVSPQGKADLVTRLQKRASRPPSKGRHNHRFTRAVESNVVAMVADGVNDSIALARADVGLAIGAGTEVAVEAADVVLVRSHLHDVVVALHLSSVVFRRIILNFAWAMCYNMCALPFAAGILYPFTDFKLPPEMAGLMMALSSVSVVTSSLLLRRYQRPNILEDGTLQEGDSLLSSICTRASHVARRQVGPVYSDVPSSLHVIEIV